MAKLARAFRVLGFGVMGVTIVGTLIGIVQSCYSMSAGDLSSADRARIQANGVAEALYNIAIGVLLAGALHVAGALTKRRVKE
jgi:biopolymer transport protein ExbB/TolQ